MSYIASVTSVLPPHSLSLQEIASSVSSLLPESARRPLLPQRAHSMTRWSALSPPELVEPRTLGERAALFAAHGARFAEATARALLDRSRIDPSSVAALACVSSTGHGLPGIAAQTARALGLDPLCRRIVVDGLGCAGGLAALGLASDLVGRERDRPALVICVELPSLSFPSCEPSTRDAIACLHFGDAAAGMLVHPGSSGHGIEIVHTASCLLPESSACGTFRLTDAGLRVSGSADLSRLLHRQLPGFVADVLRASGLRADHISFWLVQPRSPEILDATASCLGLDDGALGASLAVWNRYGNAVSASLLLALQTLAETDPPVPGSLGVMLSFGAAPSLDATVLRWPS